MNIDYPKMGQEGELGRLWQLAFGDSMEFIRGFFGVGYDREHSRCITLEGRITAALYWFDAQWEGGRLAYVYAVATHPDFRNRGLCRMLMEDTHRLLTEQGYDGAVLMPAEPGLRRMYEGMGYETCCRVSEYSCRAGERAELKKISWEEYGMLRRQFLPRDGVVQEGRNLAYLSTFAEFYAGGDFLLAGAPEGDGFRGMELLGNVAAAPGILGTLGYEKGCFRIPGGERPFAMFLPLKCGAERPGYFGLAFD